jgi:hypothetical protein
MTTTKINGLTPAENRVAEDYRRRGFKVLRRGWPDFLCISPDGDVVAVEVKSMSDALSPAQKEMHAALRDAGVEVVVDNSDWRRHIADLKAQRKGAQLVPAEVE